MQEKFQHSGHGLGNFWSTHLASRAFSLNRKARIDVRLTDLLGQSQALRIGDRSQLLFFQLLDGLLLVPQIQLGAD